MCLRSKVISVTPITTGMGASTRLSRYFAMPQAWPGSSVSAGPGPTSALLTVGDENVLHPRARLVGVVRADVEVDDPLVDSPQVVGVEEHPCRNIFRQ